MVLVAVRDRITGELCERYTLELVRRSRQVEQKASTVVETEVWRVWLLGWVETEPARSRHGGGWRQSSSSSTGGTVRVQ